MPVRGKGQRAEVFIASSGKNVGLACDVQQNLDNSANVTVWDQGVFAPDDVTEIRGRKLKSVRDNVIFELGLFIGKLGRERCFIVTPKGQEDLRLPSDLAALTLLTFNTEQTNTRAALGPACHEIGKAIKQLGILNSGPPPLSERDRLLRDIWMKVSRPAPAVPEKLSIEALPTQVAKSNRRKTKTPGRRIR
jgi:predicted nucleotide-binding protein